MLLLLWRMPNESALVVGEIRGENARWEGVMWCGIMKCEQERQHGNKKVNV